MRVAVTGGRNYKPTAADAWALKATLEFLGATELHHGGCRGVDQWSGKVAKRLSIPVVVHPYRSDLGKAGGPVRNRTMVAATDHLVKLPGGRGSADCLSAARDAGRPITFINRDKFTV